MRESSTRGNVVIGHSSNTMLKLDLDDQDEETVKQFAVEYAKFHDLGSVLVMRTSTTKQMDLMGRQLGSYSLIFGKCGLSRKELKWHIMESRRLGMVEEAFFALRKFKPIYIVIRTNPKNAETPRPKVWFYYRNGDSSGIFHFLKFYRISKMLGRKGD